MKRSLNVFVSSTAQDLLAYRTAAKEAVLSMGWRPVLVNEHDLIAAGPPLQKCVELVWQSDLFVLLAGHRCGFIPPRSVGGDDQMSITQIECAVWDAAVHQLGRFPAIVFMTKHPDLRIGAGESDVAAASQLLFRSRLAATGIKHDVEYWPDGDARQPAAISDFSAQIRTQLASVKAELASLMAVHAQASVAAAQNQLEHAKRVVAAQKQEAGSNLVVGGVIGVFVAALLLGSKA